MTNEQEAAAMFGAIFGTLIIGALLVLKVLQAREKYGVLPRGLRWIEKVAARLKSGLPGIAARVFYGDVLKEREGARLRIERETGLTPWWDDNAKTWRSGDLPEVKNRYNFVTARRPHDYVNRVATPGVEWKKELEA